MQLYFGKRVGNNTWVGSSVNLEGKPAKQIDEPVTDFQKKIWKTQQEKFFAERRKIHWYHWVSAFMIVVPVYLVLILATAQANPKTYTSEEYTKFWKENIAPLTTTTTKPPYVWECDGNYCTKVWN